MIDCIIKSVAGIRHIINQYHSLTRYIPRYYMIRVYPTILSILMFVYSVIKQDINLHDDNKELKKTLKLMPPHQMQILYCSKVEE